MLAEREAEREGWFPRLVGRLRRVVDCCLAGARTGFLFAQHKVGLGPAKEPANRKVVWKWTWKQFVEVEVQSFQIDRVLVAAGIVDSRSNAQRLIKGNGISWRRSDGVMRWAKVTDFKTEVPSGWPWILRVGDGHWRTVMVEEPGRDGKPVSKPKMFPSLVEVMRPEENQTIKFWSKLWDE